jgi:hypothetical protein
VIRTVAWALVGGSIAVYLTGFSADRPGNPGSSLWAIVLGADAPVVAVVAFAVPGLVLCVILALVLRARQRGVPVERSAGE